MDELRLSGGPKPHPIKTGTVTTVNVQTGEVVEQRPNAMTLLPPRPGVCQECAVDHDATMPHDCTSLYYRIKFAATHGREPSWSDAMQHCTKQMRQFVKTTLILLYERRGLDVPAELLLPEEGSTR